jgi:hypothetical protein
MNIKDQKEDPWKKFSETPLDVLYIKSVRMHDNTVGATYYMKVVKDNPEYFPEETERIEKWNKIPQSVHDAYEAKMNGLVEMVSKGCPPSPGIVMQVTKPEFCREYNEFTSSASKVMKFIHEKLHQEFYSKYLD